MTNIQTEVKGNKLIITVDISDKALKAAQPSGSGKTKVIATSHGNQEVGVNGIKFGLNVFYK